MGFTKKEMEEKGFTPEQIDFVMAERGKEIAVSKAELEKAKADLKEKEMSVTELNEKIKAFDGTGETLKELQDKVQTYEQKETERQAAEKQAQIDAELKSRFMAVVGENKFKHADIENGRFNAFKESLAKEEFKGKGDSDVFAEITKDMDLYVNPQQEKITMPGGGFNKNADSLSQARAIMGLPTETK